MSRTYKITEQSLGAYMKFNKMAETAVVGEGADSFILQNGNKVSPLPKAAVEAWAINHGFVEGLGYDALSEQDKGTFHSNQRRNTSVVAEREAKRAGMKDENLQAYHAQKKETILSDAMHKANMRNTDDGTDLSKVALGNKSYGKATNQ